MWRGFACRSRCFCGSRQTRLAGGNQANRVVVMTLHEETYQELRELPPSERAGWLHAHAPVELRGHWWLALIEHAQFNASPARGLPADETVNNLEFAVELVELAEADGMPA